MQIKYNSNACTLVSQANSASEAGQWVVNGSLNRDQVATARNYSYFQLVPRSRVCEVVP